MKPAGVPVAVVAGLGIATGVVPLMLLSVLPGANRTSPSATAVAAFPLLALVGAVAVVWASLRAARPSGGVPLRVRDLLLALAGHAALFVATVVLGLAFGYTLVH